MLEQLDLLAVRDLAEVLDLGGEVRPDELVEVRDLERLAHLPGELQRQARLDRRADGAVGALVRAMRPTKRR